MMSSAFPTRQRLSPGLPDSPLNPREEFRRKEPLLVPRCEDYAVRGKSKLVACVHSFLEVDVNEDIGRVPHACTRVKEESL